MRTRSMRVNVFYLRWLNTSFFHCKFHCSGCACSVLCRRSDVESICCCTVANQLGIDSCSSCLRMLQFFKNYDSGTFSKYKTTSVFVKWNRCSCDIFGLGQCSKCGKASHSCRTDTTLGSTCQHDFRIPILNCTECITNAVCSGCTGCHNICTFAAESQLNRNISCSHVRDHHRDHQWIYFSRSLGEDLFIVVFYLRKTSDTRTNNNTHTERILFFHIKASILKSFFCCCHCILAEWIHTSCGSRIHMIFCIKILNFCCDLYLVICCIKFCDRSDADFSFADSCPEILNIISNRSNGAKSGYNYSSLTHMTIPPST